MELAPYISNPDLILNSNIWLIHRIDDPQVPSRLSKQLMKTLFAEPAYPQTRKIEETEAPYILTLLEGNTHTGWDETYKSEAIYKWLLTRK